MSGLHTCGADNMAVSSASPGRRDLKEYSFLCSPGTRENRQLVFGLQLLGSGKDTSPLLCLGPMVTSHRPAQRDSCSAVAMCAGGVASPGSGSRPELPLSLAATLGPCRGSRAQQTLLAGFPPNASQLALEESLFGRLTVTHRGGLQACARDTLCPWSGHFPLSTRIENMSPVCSRGNRPSEQEDRFRA